MRLFFACVLWLLSGFVTANEVVSSAKGSGTGSSEVITIGADDYQVNVVAKGDWSVELVKIEAAEEADLVSAAKNCVDKRPEEQMPSDQQVKLLQQMIKADADKKCRFYAITWQQKLGHMGIAHKILIHDTGGRPHLTRMTYSKGKVLICQQMNPDLLLRTS